MSAPRDTNEKRPNLSKGASLLVGKSPPNNQLKHRYLFTFIILFYKIPSNIPTKVSICFRLFTCVAILKAQYQHPTVAPPPRFWFDGT